MIHVGRIGAYVRGFFSLALLAGSAPALAQAVVPQQEYFRYLSPAQQISPVASFGDQISLRDGSLSFRTTDIELPGVGPTIRITRTLKINGRNGDFPDTSGNRIGEWELELPRIKTLVNTNPNVWTGSPVGWQIGTGNSNIAASNARCTNFNPIGDVALKTKDNPVYRGDTWWAGYQFVDAEGQEEPVLAASGTFGQMAYVARTTSNWLFTCLPSTSSGALGEAFKAIAPDGTKYWLDYLTASTAESLGPDAGPDILDRAYASMLVTRIEDRFGNWVTYHYTNGLLDAIDASDGRHIGLTSSNGVTSITVGTGASARTWQYQIQYGQIANYSYLPTLSAVILPDGSAWHYSLAGLSGLNANSQPSSGFLPYATCSPASDDAVSDNNGAINNLASGSVTTPSGATATYSIGKFHAGRSNVPKFCYSMDTSPPSIEMYPKDTWNFAVTSKTLSGFGVAQAVWNYNYSSGNSSWSYQCTNGCASSVWTDVTDPDGTRHRSIFSNKFAQDENKLLREETYAAGTGALIRSADYSYAICTPSASGVCSPNYPWPLSLGTDLNSRRSAAATATWTPILATTITQDGVTFSSQVNSGCGSTYCYDTFARPLSVHKWSSLGYSRNDVTDYYDNTAHWVLGQIARHYNVESTLADVRNVYDPYTDLPVQTYAFEKLKSTMTYNADGTLATSKDGNNNTTTFSNWYRGIPKNIQFADGTGVSALVDDNGWIRAVTDENGYVTGYGYDAMGRVSGITYPNETNLTYNTTTITFAPSASAAYGLPVGHWEQVTQTGNHKKVVAFDGLWRPVVTFQQDAGSPQSTTSAVTQSYDTNGRVAYQSYPFNPNVSGWGTQPGTTTTYDSLGRVKQAKQSSELGDLTTTTEYLAGFQVRTTNPRSYPTTMGYQVYDQPSYDQLAWSAQPENKDVTITRNYFGMPTSITQADHANAAVSVTRSYVYNTNMELCRTIEPETGNTFMGYDAAGNLAWSAGGYATTDVATCAISAWVAARRSDRTYDARNRVLSLTFPDGRGNQVWTYTPDGLVNTSTVDNDGPGQGQVSQVYTYNHRRLLAGESTSQPGYTMGIGYGYDQNGNLSTQQYPNNLTVSYNPNALGQATSVASTAGKIYVSGVSYYPNGGISQFTYGNGIVHTMTQNSRQLPASSVDGGIINYGFTYDANGNPTKIADNQRGLTYDRSMTYDGLDRLTGAGSGMFGGTDNWHRFTYNALDNITSWKLAGVKDYASYIYDTSSNRLTNIQNSAGSSVVALAYDLQGNLQNKNGQTYSFDYGNRLRSATNQETYRYDAQGRRVSQGNTAGTSILSTYAMNGQLMYTKDLRRNDTLAYIYLSGSQVARVRQATVLPSAPILTAPATNAGGSYALTWSTTATTDSYVLEESANGGAWTTLYSGTATNAAVSGRAPGSYGYRIKACNSLGCSGYSATSTVQVLSAPAAAPSVTVPASSYTGAYSVSWTSVASADRYELEESFNGSGWTQVYNGGAASYGFSGRAGGNYSYRARACNIAGCGPYSATGTILVLYTPTTAPALTVPATNNTGSYTVSWSSVATATRYDLQESVNGGGWTQVYSGSAMSQGFSGKVSGSYGYQIRACNAAGCGPYSATSTVSVDMTPAVPTLSGDRTEVTNIKPYKWDYFIYWSAVANATQYQLERQSGTTVTAVYSGLNRSFSEYGPITSVYGYHVRACNGTLCSAWSAWYVPSAN